MSRTPSVGSLSTLRASCLKSRFITGTIGRSHSCVCACFPPYFLISLTSWPGTRLPLADWLAKLQSPPACRSLSMGAGGGVHTPLVMPAQWALHTELSPLSSKGGSQVAQPGSRFAFYLRLVLNSLSACLHFSKFNFYTWLVSCFPTTWSKFYLKDISFPVRWLNRTLLPRLVIWHPLPTPIEV